MGNNTTSKKTDGQMAKKNQIPAFKGKPQLGWDSRVKQQRPQQGESAKTETQTKRMQLPPRRGIYETMDMSRAELEKEILALGYDLDDDGGEWPEDEAPDLDYEMEMAKSLQGK